MHFYGVREVCLLIPTHIRVTYHAFYGQSLQKMGEVRECICTHLVGLDVLLDSNDGGPSPLFQSEDRGCIYKAKV